MDAPVTPVAIDNDHQNPSKLLPSKKNTSKVVEMAERFAFYGWPETSSLISPTTSVSRWPPPLRTSILGWRFRHLPFTRSFRRRFIPRPLQDHPCFLFHLLPVSVIPTHSRKPVFFTALYILSIGEGGHKPCVQTFAADQFDENNPEEKAAKSSFFNWWYLGIVTGASVAIVVVIYLQDNVSWAAGFGVLAGSLAVALALFLIGMKRYRKQRPTGSPFTRGLRSSSRRPGSGG
ncbi:hypothetical protein CXB51_004121 [Gossypium anomalum]|uniref:Uncharacterized protein n=1 Tax=Gossypium anomalum TaxID=47600 RepID=A0A8J6DAN5_9ROSI|nr:hypothetical protein CXB51_004121 [Gossypium anomalum]